MITETMTIHEALAVLKTLDNRISVAIADNAFVGVRTSGQTKINGITIDDFKKNATSALDSINGMIRRRNALRSAIAQSNAQTTVTIANEEYTISRAIEMRKNGMALKSELVDSLSRQLNSCSSTIMRENGEKLQQKADSYVMATFGGKDKVSSEDAAAAREMYIKANTMELIDPINVSNTIKQLRDEIETFMAEVDAKISVSNALTVITVEY